MAENGVEPLQRKIELLGRRQRVCSVQSLNFRDVSTMERDHAAPAKEEEEFLSFRDCQYLGIR
jgi:hypothetical protein